VTDLSSARATGRSSPQRLQLIVGSTLLGLAAVCVAATVRLVSDRGPDVWLVALAASMLVVLGGLAGASMRARRESARILVVCVDAASIALAALAGLAVLLLALGRQPVDGE
jgi:hypothetical protein